MEFGSWKNLKAFRALFMGCVPPGFCMQVRVCRPGVRQKKIRDVVIGSIPINMMDSFFNGKRTANSFLNDMAMLKNLLSVNVYVAVAKAINCSAFVARVPDSASILEGAKIRAELDVPRWGSINFRIKRFVASFTEKQFFNHTYLSWFKWSNEYTTTTSLWSSYGV